MAGTSAAEWHRTKHRDHPGLLRLVVGVRDLLTRFWVLLVLNHEVDNRICILGHSVRAKSHPVPVPTSAILRCAQLEGITGCM